MRWNEVSKKPGLRVAHPEAQPRSMVVRPAALVRPIRPYEAVSSLDHIHAHPAQVPHKLDWNEATVPPSPKVIEAVQAFLGQAHHLNWYPVLNSTNLAEKLAVFHRVGEDQLLITNGSDQALDTICTTYLSPGDPVLVASPTYQHFLVFAQTRGAEIVHHYGEDLFAADVDGLVEAIKRVQPRLVYVVSPNNPTGVEYSAAQVAALCEATAHGLVIVDEAYSEFSGRSAMGLLHTYSNLIVTRTFSKAYGMAGLRIGYAVSHPVVVEDMRRVFNPKSVNVLAQVGAMAALDDQAWLAWYVDQVTRAKDLMAEWCAARDVPFRTTAANFVMLQFDRAPWVVRSLQEVGVYVRDRSHLPRLSGWVRFSVGTVEQTKDVLARLGTVLDRLVP
ncbi:MAG: histidinol-phosphate aminotransferase family protein [Myxococcales bacterium]|nr:histidinol-phosphate aminotransferase family protein [Myxococcales bacterium]